MSKSKQIFSQICSLKLLAAVSLILIRSRFLELAPDLEHFGYLQQPDSHVAHGLIILTKNPDRGLGICFRIRIKTLFEPH